MRKILFFLTVSLFICFCLNQLSASSKDSQYFIDYESMLINKSKTFYGTKCTYTKQSKTSNCITNDPLFTDIIPNPIVYWYGTSTNNEPILLLNFSAGIPIRWLTNEETSDLDAIVLKLKIPEQYGYFYKILNINGEPILQTITYKPESTTNVKLDPSYSGMSAGSLEYQYKNALEFKVDRPIITFSGVSSDTLTIMLKRGKQYPIPNCQIKVSMLVRAIKKDTLDTRCAINFYNEAIKPCNDFKFDKAIEQIEKKPLFVKKLPLISKIIAIPIIKLAYPPTNDIKVIKPSEELFITSRVIKGSHSQGGYDQNNNCIVNFLNGTVRDDDIFYKEMNLPYQIIQQK